MKLTNRYDGSDSPFEGDRTLYWRSLPANARVTKAIAKLTPAQSATGELFEEIIAFSGGQGELGATKIVGAGFVEVDFHKRRTLARVMGPGTENANLQVDLGGGVYVEINDKGAIRAPDDVLFAVPEDGKLPGLLVTKFKLTAAGPIVTQVTIRSVPANVSVRLGNLPPFWTHLGELTVEDVSPDFTAVLQAFLAEAKTENGFYNVPLILHSDAIARLKVTLDVEYQIEASVMPQGLDEVLLPFDFSSLPNAQENVLQVTAPANTRVAPGGVTARVKGAFEETRIVYGPAGEVTPAGTAEISPVASQAQIISLPERLKAAAFDLFTVVTHPAKLQLDLREDLDGKPGDHSLLPETVTLELAAPVGTAQDGKTSDKPRWVSVALPAEFEFNVGQRYWLVLQSLEGQAGWSAVSGPAGSAGMQHTKDGGLSWRDTIVAGISGPTSAFFRLRRKPKRFKTPIELQVGSGEQAIRVGLDRFQPLGRVDFALDFDEIGEAFNQYLGKTSPAACPETEHLVNGDFQQWLRIGEKLGVPTGIPFPGSERPTMVAISPDGRLAYIGSDDVMQLVDVACNSVLDETFDISGVPKALVFHPAGGRAYLLGFDRLQVIDTDLRKTLGGTLSLKGGANAQALSSDGSLLYVTEYVSDNGSVRVIDTLKLEQAVINGAPILEDVSLVAVRNPIELGEQRQPTALAVAPDGSRLYVAIVKHDAKDGGEIRIFETATLEQRGEPIPVGQQPQAIVLTPDGKRVMVADEGANNVILIDADRRTPIGSPIAVGTKPLAVVISPDGIRAYVANSDSRNLSIIDLTRRAVIETIGVGTPPVALALTPQGDQLYVVISVSSPLTASFSGPIVSIQVGAHLPAEWNLTSGKVTPFCLPDPFHHLIAVLGSPPNEGDQQILTPSAISQVVPVAEACAYEFSFWGIATDADALAEVLWIGQDCGLLRKDQISIQALERSELEARTLTHVIAVATQQPFLKPHRARLLAPAGAKQAEVRFSTPVDIQAAIALVSLAATTEAVANADLSLRQLGQLAGWSLLSASVSGVTVVAVEAGIQLRNASAETVEFVQIITAKGGQPFNLEFRGRTIARPSAKDNPRIELRWFDSGQSAAPPVILEIPPTGFDTVSANGTSPARAAEAELRLVVSAGTALEVKRVSLRFSTATPVPVTFIAQAPGELTVSNWHVAFEQSEAAAPRIPEKGLCAPTPPGREPGETPDNCCFCPCCETERTMTELAPVETEAGRPAVVGRCASCGGELVRFGGQRIPGARRFSLERRSVSRPIVAT